MSVLKKRELSVGVMFITAMICIIAYFVSGIKELSDARLLLGNWGIVISAITMGLGVLNLTIINGRNVMRRGRNWYFNMWLIIIMFVTFGLAAFGGTGYAPYKWIFDKLYTPGSQAFFSLSFLYTCVAGFVAFRIKNVESTLLLLAAFFGIVGRTPLLISYWGGFVTISDWIANTPSGGTFLAFKISVALGLILIGIRTITGIERTSMGEEVA